ncbi:hypothetical protein ABEB36_010687 [Hypothenemus hampei]|uniref:Uncharacterized protein n=1 Tax=Hypothenemus hampei TaxID=57062 RepID=A0ABD1ECU8_HYPHA
MSHPAINIKKPKTYHYHDEWEEEFFFAMKNNKCICIICLLSVALPKRANVERHFRTVHKQYENNYPLGTEIRKAKVKQLMMQLSMQQSYFMRSNTKSKSATMASFKVAEILTKHKKPFEDGEIWKEGFIKAGELLFQNFKNKSEIISVIKDLSLSRNTVMRRTEAINGNLEELLKENIDKCRFLSLQFDESTDITDIAQLCVFIRMVFQDMSVTEELLTILPMKGQTRGHDIYNSFKSFINKTEFPIHKLVSITTDGAPAMIGKHNGFIALCKNDDDIPNFTNYHCIIHQQVLCSKVLNSDNVMNVAFKIVNSIRGSSLQRRKFRALLEECESDLGELLLHTDVRWLSRAKFLKRFLDLLPEIKEFMATTNKSYPQLEDNKWVLDLAFLSDITAKLNELNLQLQGKNKTLTDMVSAVNTFKAKLSLLETQLRKGNLRQFENMAAKSKERNPSEYDQYADKITLLRNEFVKRFKDISQIEDVIFFMSFPFNNEIQIEEISIKFKEFLDVDQILIEEEILKLKYDIFLKSRASSQNNFWNLLCEEKYPYLWRCAAYLTTFFGSTFLCESTFSTMNAIKTKHRSRLTDDHLTACLRIATSSYEPNYHKLAENMQCHVSNASFDTT